MVGLGTFSLVDVVFLFGRKPHLVGLGRRGEVCQPPRAAELMDGCR